MATDLAQHHRRSGDGMTLIDVHDTRPGGPNRQERDHRVGTPESLTEATKETGMLQVHTCVSVHCDQCGDALGSPGFEAHYPSEDTALDAATTESWLVGPGGRLWCSACAPVLTCEAEGHQFSGWRHPLTRDGQPASSEYRHCRRCCLHESRPAEWLISRSTPGGGEFTVAALLVAGAEVAGEVA